MLVNDFDNEYTLEEEEAMESAESITNELDDLQREGEMPLNEVLAMYGYESGIEYDDTNQEVPEHDSDSSLMDSPQQMMENPDSPRIITSQMLQSQSHSSPIDEPKNGVMDLVSYDAPDVPMGSSHPLLRSVHQASESSDTGADYDYSPDDDWRKNNMLGINRKKAEKIIGVTKGTSGEILYLVKWNEKESSVLPSSFMAQHFPQKVIQFLEERFVWVTTPDGQESEDRCDL